MASEVSVPLDVRLRLAHACLEHLAGSAGARVLHVKGVALHPRLAAGRAPSSDCDVLVHPADVADYTAVLAREGWRIVTRFEHGSVFAHAATYYHPVWGTVDVHRAFPGIDRDPAAAFEMLWEGRESVDLGGLACAVPDLPAQRLLLLVHAARDAMGRRDHDRRVSWDEADPEERRRIDELARRLGALVPLALVTDRPALAAGEPDRRTWQAAFDGADPTTMWRARVRDARGADRARVLVNAARVNPDHLALRLGRVPTREDLRREWWDRWRRAGRRLLRRAGDRR